MKRRTKRFYGGCRHKSEIPYLGIRCMWAVRFTLTPGEKSSVSIILAPKPVWKLQTKVESQAPTRNCIPVVSPSVNPLSYPSGSAPNVRTTSRDSALLFLVSVTTHRDVGRYRKACYWDSFMELQTTYNFCFVSACSICKPDLDAHYSFHFIMMFTRRTRHRNWLRVRIPMRLNLSNPSSHTMSPGFTQPLTEINIRGKNGLWVKRGRRVSLTTTSASVSRSSKKYDILEISQPYGMAFTMFT
jgi:hypothetical protein